MIYSNSSECSLTKYRSYVESKLMVLFVCGTVINHKIWNQFPWSTQEILSGGGDDGRELFILHIP